MAQTNLNIRIDENLKKQLESVVDDFGMNITTAITIFAKAVVRERRIPFDIKASDPFYSEANIKYLENALKKFDQGNYKEHELIEVDDEENMAR